MANHARRFGRSAGRESLASDFRMIFEAVADAFRGLSASVKVDGRSRPLRTS